MIPEIHRAKQGVKLAIAVFVDAGERRISGIPAGVVRIDRVGGTKDRRRAGVGVKRIQVLPACLQVDAVQRSPHGPEADHERLRGACRKTERCVECGADLTGRADCRRQSSGSINLIELAIAAGRIGKRPAVSQNVEPRRADAGRTTDRAEAVGNEWIDGTKLASDESE